MQEIFWAYVHKSDGHVVTQAVLPGKKEYSWAQVSHVVVDSHETHPVVQFKQVLFALFV